MQGLVSAAGLSSRMGEHKMRLAFAGRSLLETTLMNLRRGGVGRIAVVLGRDADLLRKSLNMDDLIFVENQAYAETEMIDSMRLGYEALDPSGPVLICPGDMPLISPSTIQYLLKHAHADVVLPTFEGQAGHPLYLSRRVADRIPQERESLRAIVQSVESQEVPVWDRGVLMDVDRPEDYEEALNWMEQKRSFKEAYLEDLRRFLGVEKGLPTEDWPSPDEELWPNGVRFLEELSLC